MVLHCIMSFSFAAYLTNERCFIRARVVKGGDPRQNRAMAAKLVYPDLTMRECCYLGGFQDDELNAVKDQKHTWRTGGLLFHSVCTIPHFSHISFALAYIRPQA